MLLEEKMLLLVVVEEPLVFFYCIFESVCLAGILSKENLFLFSKKLFEEGKSSPQSNNSLRDGLSK